MKKVIIFDFDGTVADTLDIAIQVASTYARQVNPVLMNKKNLRSMTMREVFRAFNITLFHIPFFLHKYRSELSKQILTVPIATKDLSLILRALHKKHILGVLTSNSAKNVRAFLIKNKLNYFDFIYAENTVFGKQHMLKHLMNKHRFKPEQTYYVGDETRDIDAARKAGITSVAVAWGFNERKLLAKYQPDFLLNNPKALLKIFSR